MDYVKLGKLLQTGRKQKGYTQQFVSSMLGVTPQNVSSWELGKSKMDIDSYVKLCNLFDIDFVSSVMECSNDPCMPHFPVELDADGDRLDGVRPMSDDEKNLLSMYRSLNDQGKEYILQTLTMATQVYIKSDFVPSVEKNIG